MQGLLYEPEDSLTKHLHHESKKERKKGVMRAWQSRVFVYILQVPSLLSTATLSTSITDHSPITYDPFFSPSLFPSHMHIYFRPLRFPLPPSSLFFSPCVFISLRFNYLFYTSILRSHLFIYFVTPQCSQRGSEFQTHCGTLR